MVLALLRVLEHVLTRKRYNANLPILGITREHHRVFWLADLAGVVILNLLDIFLGLNAVVLREGALMAGTSCVGEEMRSNGLDATLCCCSELSNCLEILLARPSLRKDGEWKGDLCMGGHVDLLLSQIGLCLSQCCCLVFRENVPKFLDSYELLKLLFRDFICG